MESCGAQNVQVTGTGMKALVLCVVTSTTTALPVERKDALSVLQDMN